VRLVLCTRAASGRQADAHSCPEPLSILRVRERVPEPLHSLRARRRGTSRRPIDVDGLEDVGISDVVSQAMEVTPPRFVHRCAFMHQQGDDLGAACRDSSLERDCASRRKNIRTQRVLCIGISAGLDQPCDLSLIAQGGGLSERQRTTLPERRCVSENRCTKQRRAKGGRSHRRRGDARREQVRQARHEKTISNRCRRPDRPSAARTTG